jgi:hypothetical protein
MHYAAFGGSKDLFTPQNFFGGEAAVYSCKNCQRTIIYNFKMKRLFL